MVTQKLRGGLQVCVCMISPIVLLTAGVRVCLYLKQFLDFVILFIHEPFSHDNFVQNYFGFKMSLKVSRVSGRSHIIIMIYFGNI